MHKCPPGGQAGMKMVLADIYVYRLRMMGNKLKLVYHHEDTLALQKTLEEESPKTETPKRIAII
jgi:hypothetical protein